MNQQLFTPIVYLQNELYDLEYINILSQGWDNRWKRMQSGSIQAKLWVYTTPLMQLSYVNYNNGIMIEGSHPRGSIVLSFIRTDTISNINNKKIEHYELVVLKYGESFDYLASGANEIFTFAIEEQFFEQEFMNYFDITIEKVRKENRIVLQQDLIDSLIYKMEFWLNYLQQETKQHLEFHQYLQIQNSLLQELFSLMVIQEKKHTKNSSYVQRAREILEDNKDNIYSIKELIDTLDINARTLQYHFKKELGVSPKQYLQNLRFNAIYKELCLADPHNTTISDITLKYGFFHPSHFGAEYKKFFQETPTQTLYKNKIGS
jgi:AraC-like DNA-binding protein